MDGLVFNRRITWWVCVKKRTLEVVWDRLKQKTLARGRRCLLLGLGSKVQQIPVQWNGGGVAGLDLTG